MQEQSRPQQHTWNSKPFIIFPAEILLHKVYISNILCGLRLLIQDVYCIFRGGLPAVKCGRKSVYGGSSVSARNRECDGAFLGH
jgi:hypothetical protein